MIVRPVSQPDSQLGRELQDLLVSDTHYRRIIFVSAFVAFRTVLRLRDRLLAQVGNGAELRLVVGIDLGGTSREVLEEFLRWNTNTLVFHNPLSRATFHPKVYLLEQEAGAVLFIGSNNFTDGGFYTNYEMAARFDFVFPQDNEEYANALIPLQRFLNPNGGTVRALDRNLIDTLVARGELPTEAEARRQTGRRARGQAGRIGTIPPNPFSGVGVPLPPLLPRELRREDQPLGPRVTQGQVRDANPEVTLVWRKRLTNSDALDVRAGTAHVGGVRLTQAGFENPPGQRINQTSYFRNLFADYHWVMETGRHRAADQEHAFIRMGIRIRGRDFGVYEFEISHKPSGEAGQNNDTTILRWGAEFNRIVPQQNLSGALFSLYETDDDDAPFLIDITD